LFICTINRRLYLLEFLYSLHILEGTAIVIKLIKREQNYMKWSCKQLHLNFERAVWFSVWSQRYRYYEY